MPPTGLLISAPCGTAHVSHLQTGAVNTQNPGFPNSLEVSAFSDGKPRTTLWYEAVYSLLFHSLHSGGVHNRTDPQSCAALLVISGPDQENSGWTGQGFLIPGAHEGIQSCLRITPNSVALHSSVQLSS